MDPKFIIKNVSVKSSIAINAEKISHVHTINTMESVLED